MALYKSLNISTLDLSGTSDANGITRYSFNVASDFVTERFSVGKEHKVIKIEAQTTTFSGSGILTLQHSLDGIVWYNLIGSSGSTAEITLDGSPANDYIITKEFPIGYIRLSYDGTGSTGSMVILLEL
jgi:hypothetical protein